MTERSLVEKIANVLVRRGWQIDVGPRISNFIPDLVGEDPQHRRFVFEVKSGPEGGHLGALGQVETYRNALADARGEKPEGVLVLIDDGPHDLDEIASASGVRILRIGHEPSSDDFDQLDIRQKGKKASADRAEFDALRGELEEVVDLERNLAERKARLRTAWELVWAGIAGIAGIATVVGLTISSNQEGIGTIVGIVLAIANLVVIGGLGFSFSVGQTYATRRAESDSENSAQQPKEI
jgi:hypothetical protein